MKFVGPQLSVEETGWGAGGGGDETEKAAVGQFVKYLVPLKDFGLSGNGKP